jgi:hypothetical protein
MKPLAILVGLMMLAGGCSTGEGEKPLTITVKNGGCFDLDGRYMPTYDDLQQAFRESVMDRSFGEPGPDAVIRVEDPSGVPYEHLSSALIVCGSAFLSRLEVEGVPLRYSWSRHPPPTGDFQPAFDPIMINARQDLDRLRTQPELFKGRGVMIRPQPGTPSDLVIATMKTVHEAGGVVGLFFAYYDDKTARLPITLCHVPIDKNGYILPYRLRPFLFTDPKPPPPDAPAPRGEP